MTTLARPVSQDGSHWYTKDGQPCHTVKCTTKDGERPTTIADARKLGLLPSVTNILRVLHKPALESWKIEQACLSVLTAPPKEGEELDAFVERVLHEERQQDQEAKTAADLGTRIHKALEDELSGRVAEHEMLPWIEPVWDYLNRRGGTVLATEQVCVGCGYAGRVDLAYKNVDGMRILFDFKTTKKIPKSAYWEHRMQLAAYAACQPEPSDTANIYISTLEPGKYEVCEHGDWRITIDAFRHLVNYWQIANDYYP